MKKPILPKQIISFLLISTLASSFSYNLAMADEKDEVSAKKTKLEEQNEKANKTSAYQKMLSKEKEILDNENMRLTKELEAINAKIPELEEKLKTTEGEIKAGREEIAHAKSNLEERQKLKNLTQDKINQFSKERIELKETYAKTNAATISEEKILKEKNAELDKQAELSKNEQIQLAKESEKIKRELTALTSQSATKQNSLEKIQEILKNTKNSLATLKGQKDTLISAIAKIDEDKKKALQDNQDASKDIIKTKTEITQLKNRSEVAKQNQINADALYKATAKEAAQLNEINGAEAARLKKTEEDVSELQGMIKAGKLEVERAKKEREALLKKNGQALLEKPKLEAQLAQLKLQYKMLNDKNMSLKQNSRN